jgi:SHAQKYF class myb-like DNA-binding protein
MYIMLTHQHLCTHDLAAITLSLSPCAESSLGRNHKRRGPSLDAAPKKKRIRWTEALHARFERAVVDMGGAHSATPKGILERMNAPEVTIMHAKSHLQKYRLTLSAASSVRKGLVDRGPAEDGPQSRHLPASKSSKRIQKKPPSHLELVTNDAIREQDMHASASMIEDQADRENLIATLMQQHLFQEELRHQIMVREKPLQVSMLAWSASSCSIAC